MRKRDFQDAGCGVVMAGLFALFCYVVYIYGTRLLLWLVR
jgi:hypothetical protein